MPPEQITPQLAAKHLVGLEIAAASRSEKGGRPVEALVHYRNALQQAGADRTVFSDVVRQVAGACQRRPKDAALRHLLGSAYLFERDIRSAETHLRKAAALSPRSAPILRSLGDCL